jgi:hypothetical protein
LLRLVGDLFEQKSRSPFGALLLSSEKKKFTQMFWVKLQRLYDLAVTHPVSRGEKKVLAELMVETTL